MANVPSKTQSINDDRMQNRIPVEITLEQFHKLLDNVQIMVVILDVKGHVIFCNKLFQTILSTVLKSEPAGMLFLSIRNQSLQEDYQMFTNQSPLENYLSI